MNTASNDPKPTETNAAAQPLDAANRQLQAAKEKLTQTPDVVTKAVDQGAARLAQGIDTFTKKQEKMLGALDTFLKKF